VTLSEFKRLVEAEFGPNLQNATPANVREFLDRLQNSDCQEGAVLRYEMREEHAHTYEEIIKDFFARTLDMPAQEAVVSLWIVAIELAFAMVEYQYSEQLDPLFQSIDD
jgi:hypothetical protein